MKSADKGETTAFLLEVVMARGTDPEGTSYIQENAGTIDANGLDDLPRNAEAGGDPDVSSAEERSKAAEDGIRRLETQSRVSGEPAQALSGVQHNALAAGEKLSGPNGDRARRDREFRQMMDLVSRLDWLNQEIDRLQGLIEANSARIAELESRLDVLDDLETLAERGELDASSPEHARMLRLAGIDPASVRDGNVLQAIRDRRRDTLDDIEDLRDANADLQDQVDQLIQERDELAERLGQAEEIEDRLTSADTPREFTDIVASTDTETAVLASRPAEDPDISQAVYEAAGLSEAVREEDDQMAQAVSTADFSDMFGAAPPPETSTDDIPPAAPTEPRTGPAEAVYGEEFSGNAPPVAEAFTAVAAPIAEPARAVTAAAEAGSTPNIDPAQRR